MKIILIIVAIAFFLVGAYFYGLGRYKLLEDTTNKPLGYNPVKASKPYKIIGLILTLIGLILLWTQSVWGGSIASILVLFYAIGKDGSSNYQRAKSFFKIYKKIKSTGNISNEYMIQYVAVEEYLKLNKKILFSHDSIKESVFENKREFDDLKKLVDHLMTSEDVFTSNYGPRDFQAQISEYGKKATAILKAYNDTFR